MTFIKSDFPYSQTGYFTPLILDYLSGKEELKKFYTALPTPEAFGSVIETKSKQKINRRLLVEVLNRQYKSSGLELKSELATSLLDERTFTVTTGHQLCVFTGPLYFIYKIVSTINLARELKTQFPENNFVPVYWMASEDHDFAEINHIHLFGKKLVWNSEQAGIGTSAVGRLSCADMDQLLKEVEALLGENEQANYLKALFQKAYAASNNLASATRILVCELFKSTELVVLDADDVTLKKEFSPYIEQDLLRRENATLVNESISALEALNYKAQVNPREINCFYMKEQLRERIVFENGSYLVNNTNLQFTQEELIAELSSHPERFSPNVVLRPLYQEVILPNLAYIGGGGEIAYWLEYKKMFEHNHIPFPILFLRNSALVVDAASADKWNKLGLKEADLFGGYDQLAKDYVAGHATVELSLTDDQQQIRKQFENIAQKVLKIDVTLKASVEAEMQKTLNSIQNLENKLLKAEKNKQEVVLNQLKKIKEKLFPEGNLQERHENFISLYLKFGPQLIPALLEQLKPFNS